MNELVEGEEGAAQEDDAQGAEGGDPNGNEGGAPTFLTQDDDDANGQEEGEDAEMAEGEEADGGESDDVMCDMGDDDRGSEEGDPEWLEGCFVFTAEVTEDVELAFDDNGEPITDQEVLYMSTEWQHGEGESMGVLREAESNEEPPPEVIAFARDERPCCNRSCRKPAQKGLDFSGLPYRACGRVCYDVAKGRRPVRPPRKKTKFVSYKSCADAACRDPSCTPGPPVPEVLGSLDERSFPTSPETNVWTPPDEIDLRRTPVLKQGVPRTDEDPDAIQGTVYLPPGKIALSRQRLGNSRCRSRATREPPGPAGWTLSSQGSDDTSELKRRVGIG